MESKSKSTQQNRHIRIFISSTFRDMHEERDILIKHTFPELRNRCRERGVELTEVDLRWGVTEEQAENGEVLGVCLQEIENCRPYFIGLIGERYGWVPPKKKIKNDVFQSQPWLEEHLDKSVTEMEILHGVLRNPEMAGKAFFYFRDPAYLKQLEVDRQIDFRETSPQMQKKLRQLKDKIRNSAFPVKENYKNPRAVADMILEDLWDAIDQDFPEGSEPDPLDREAMEHEQFAQSRRKVYIGRQEYFDRLTRHAESQDPPLVIKGESGSGKTALVANWVDRYRKQSPDLFILQHYIGSTAESTDYIKIIRRIMQELNRQFDLQQELPDNPEELKKAFPNWLHMAAAKGKMVLVLDGLNQLEDKDNAHGLYWLPEYFPPEIRVIISTLPGAIQENLDQRRWPEYKVKGLQPEERRELIMEYLGRYRKTLDEKQLQTIIESEQTTNPLYLKVLLDELRVFGSFEQLNQQIRYYLDARTIDDLYEKMLERLENDYETQRPGLVKDSLSLIWASRRGLSENELLEMLGETENPLPRATWSPLYLALEESLVSRQGLLNFFHDYLRKAVYDRYIQNKDNEVALRNQIAAYFHFQKLSDRKVEELPWQYFMAEEWDGLYQVLQDLDLFYAAWRKDQEEVKSYWARLEQIAGLLLKDAYRNVIEKPEEYNTLIARELAHLLFCLSHYEEVQQLNGNLINKSTTISRNQIANILGNQGLLLMNWGKMVEAMELLKREEEMYIETGSKEGIAASKGNQALIMQQWGRLQEAMILHKQEEQICRDIGNQDGLSRTLGNQAVILKDWEKLNESLDLLKQQEKICREFGNKDGVGKSLGNQAIILKDWGRLEEAMELFKQVEQIFRELGNKDDLQNSLGNQAKILIKLKKYEEAMQLLKEQEEICCKLGNKDGLIKSWEKQGSILFNLGQLEKAISFYKKIESLSKEINDKNKLCVSLGYQSLILRDQKKSRESLNKLKNQSQICKEIDNKSILKNNYGLQSSILIDLCEYEESINLLQKKKEICLQLDNKESIIKILHNQALISKKIGKLSNVIDFLNEQEKIAWENHLTIPKSSLNLKKEIEEKLKTKGEKTPKQTGKTKSRQNISKDGIHWIYEDWGIYTDTRDQQQYDVLKAGSQIWMVNNLAYMPHVSRVKKQGGIWVYDYNGKKIEIAKESENYKKYGCLYDWESARQAVPEGWHLPSDNEWNELFKFFENMKSFGEGLQKITEMSKEENKKRGLMYTKEFAGGYRHPKGYFFNLAGQGNWWTATEKDKRNAFSWTLDFHSLDATRYSSDKQYGMSVLCVLNAS